MKTKDKDNIEIPSKTPKLKELKAAIDGFATNASYYYSRAGLYYDARYCLWDGQSDDGRKNAADLGEDPFPWEGASDTRVRLADKIIKERKRLRKLAYWGRQVQARPIGDHHAQWAAAVNPLVRWMLYAADPKMVKRELNLKWSYMDCYGSVVMGVFWERTTRLRARQVILEDLVQLAMQSQDPAAMAALDVLMDPLREEEAIGFVERFFPGLGAGKVRRFLNELRTTGTASLDVPEIIRQVPRWIALRPFVDVFFDPGLDDLQRAPLVAYREFFTETELRDKVNTDGWDRAFVEECIKKKGCSILSSPNPLLMQTITRRRFRTGTVVEDNAELIEILHCYYKARSRASDDATAIYCTVMHSEINDQWGLHEMVESADGDMPFEAFTMESEERPILESRGIPEIVMTWQRELKQTRDFHSDRLSIDILPPLITPRNQAGQVTMGPAQQLERGRGSRGDYEFLAIPPMAQSSTLFGREVEREINDYFGRSHPEADPTMVQAARQELVTDALLDLTVVVVKSFALAQQNLSDEELQIICGWAGSQVRADRAMIQGRFAIEFIFDVRTMDTTFIETYGKIFKDIIVPLDRAGTIDLTQVVGLLLGSVSPWMAERVQKSTGEVKMQDVEDEQNQLAKLLVGIEPPMKEVSNPELRLQVLMDLAQRSPSVQQKIQTDPVVKALFENRVKQMQFALAQTQNAQTGKFGAEPVLGGDGSGMPLPLGMSRLEAAAGGRGV